MVGLSQNLPQQTQEGEFQPQRVPTKAAARVDSRRMARAELLGSHTHQCADGTQVHISKRSGIYLARGSFGGARFGKSLGVETRSAEIELRKILVDIDDGRFQRSSDCSKQRFAKTNPQRITVRDLFNKFLQEIRQLLGAKTEQKYADRLSWVLDFSDCNSNLRTYPFVMDIDRAWSLQLREHLFNARTTRNGHANGVAKPLSQKHIRNVLETLRNAFHWAQTPEVRLIPTDWRNPITTDFIGPKVVKDPLRQDKIPLANRIKLVAAMGESELCLLAISMLLPLRASEATGLLISEVDLEAQYFIFGTRFEGADFTKGKTAFVIPFPEEILPILRHLIGNRQEGPLLLAKKYLSKNPAFVPNNLQVLSHEYKSFLSQVSRKVVTCENDRKSQFRRFLQRRCGGISPDQVNKAFKSVCQLTGLEAISLGTMRSSVSMSMKRAGINHLEMRYLTGHTTNDILNEYVNLDPQGEMAKYFATIRPLLEAVQAQAKTWFRQIPEPGRWTTEFWNVESDRKVVVHKWCTKDEGLISGD